MGNSTAELRLGLRCQVSVGKHVQSRLRASIKRYGTIAYIGAVEGLPGKEWIGVQLDQASGRNDGSKHGVRYFECRPAHGLFVQRQSIILQSDEKSVATQTSNNQKIHRIGEQKLDELVQEFWKEFNAKEIFIRHCINTLLEKKTSTDQSGIDRNHSESMKENLDFEKLIAISGEMRKTAAQASSLFLSKYDIRQTNLIVANLLQLIEKTRATFAPRTRFTFTTARKLRSQKKSTLVSVSSDASIPTSTDTTTQIVDPDDENELSFSDKANEVIQITEEMLGTNISERRDLSFTRLVSCTIFISVETAAVRCHHLKDCQIFTGPIWGSLYINHCESCTFISACRQLRVHWTVYCNFYIRIKSHPIIENCTQLIFGPYKLQYANLEKKLQVAFLEKENGLWSRVNDFNWHKTQQSPNWSLYWDAKKCLKLEVPDSLKDLVSIV